MAETGFDAFISYRRSDGTRMARALRRRLQAYDISKRLPGRETRKLRVFLDTVYERGADDFYEKNIFPALTRSRFLIVLATPEAILRPDNDDWILREITDFRANCDTGNILVVRALGDFQGELPGDLSKTLPNVQIIDLRGEGTLAALSPLRATRLADEWLKLVAPLFDVEAREMPLLRREQERAQQMRLGLAFGAVIGAMAFSALVAALAVKANLKAESAISESLFAIGQLLRGTADLPNDGKTFGTKSRMMVSACDLFDSLSGGKIPNGYVFERALCDTDRAKALSESGEKHRAEFIINKLRKEVEHEYDTAKSADALAAMRHVLDYDWARYSADMNTSDPTVINAALEENLGRSIELRKAFPTDRAGVRHVTRRIWRLIKRTENAKRYDKSRKLVEMGLREITDSVEALQKDTTTKPDALRNLGFERVKFARRMAWIDIHHLDQPRLAIGSCEQALNLLKDQAVRVPYENNTESELTHHWEKATVLALLGAAHEKLRKWAAAATALEEAQRSLLLLRSRNLSNEFAKKVKRRQSYVAEKMTKMHSRAAAVRKGVGGPADRPE